MPRKKRWEWSSTGQATAEVKLFAWKYFTDFIYQEMLDYETYIWRGHRCDSWILEPTIERLIKKAKIQKNKQRSFRRSHLEQFKYAARGRRGPNPAVIESENEWWALGQHHGLSTPLLDWTASPFVAAYFAFIGTGDHQTTHRVVYALHKPSVEAAVAKKQRDEERERDKKKKEMDSDKRVTNALAVGLLNAPIRPKVEFIRPFSDENQRLVNQGGLFSRAPDGKPLDVWVQENVEDSGYTLIKILVPNKDREGCLRTLNRMNINHLTLFPDLYGASRFCNLFGEIEKY